jgi:hypothetical protein
LLADLVKRSTVRPAGDEEVVDVDEHNGADLP